MNKRIRKKRNKRLLKQHAGYVALKFCEPMTKVSGTYGVKLETCLLGEDGRVLLRAKVRV